LIGHGNPLPDHPDRSKSPTLSDRNQSFEEARADFEAAWQVFLSKRTEADFQAWLDQRDWTARKYALWDAGKRLEPSPRGTCQTVDSISQRGSPTPTAAHGTMGSGVNAARHESLLAMPIALTRFNFSSHEGWFDMRDLGAVLDHEEPLPHPACDQAQ